MKMNYLWRDGKIRQLSSDSTFHHVHDFFSIFEELLIFFVSFKGLTISLPCDSILFYDKVFFRNVDLTELTSKIHQNLFLFAFNLICSFNFDFFCEFRVCNTSDKHLVLDLLADSFSKIEGNDNWPWLVVQIVCDVGESQRAGKGEVELNVHWNDSINVWKIMIV